MKAWRAEFAIWIVTPDGYMHSRCFEEVALALRSAFGILGADVEIVTQRPDYCEHVIALGANLLPLLAAHQLPRGLIIYNLEQILDESPWLQPAYLDLLRRYPVWDYSDRNITALRALGIHGVTRCGIGYAPELTRIVPAEEDIDVLFVGSINDRRRVLLDDLTTRNLKVTAAFGLYGDARDALIARAKLVLNVHYYDSRVFEIVRVSYLLANHKCVVSESGSDSALEAPLKEGLAFAPYEGLADICVALVADAKTRAHLATRGFELFKALPQSDMLRKALASG